MMKREVADAIKKKKAREMRDGTWKWYYSRKSSKQSAWNRERSMILPKDDEWFLVSPYICILHKRSTEEEKSGAGETGWISVGG